MAVQNKVLYTFRGWIAFVAFMDLGTAGRSYIERRSFLNQNGDIITLLGLIYLPSKLKLFGQIPGVSGMDREVDDENVQ
ncbi:Erg28-domain containing protein, partial [Operophtera brumata]